MESRLPQTISHGKSLNESGQRKAIYLDLTTFKFTAQMFSSEENGRQGTLLCVEQLSGISKTLVQSQHCKEESLRKLDFWQCGPDAKKRVSLQYTPKKEHIIPGFLRLTPEVKVLATKPQTLSSVPELIWWNERASSYKLS